MARSFAQGRRPEGPRDEDPFVETVLRASAWAQENAPVVILVVVVLALGIAGVFYYRNYRASVTEQAALELQTLVSEARALEGAGFAERLQGFVARYRGTEAAAEARLLLARTHLDAGEPASAVEALEPVLDRRADTPLGYAGRRLLAAAREAQNDLEGALRVYADLGASAGLPFQRRAALADRARLLVEAGRRQEAAALYADLARRAEEGDAPDEAALYRVRLGEVRAAAGRPADSPSAQPVGSGSSEPPASGGP